MNKDYNASPDVVSQGEQGSIEGTASQEKIQLATENSNAEQKDTVSNDEKTEYFNKMINGEYKAEYRNALENALSKRLRTSNKKLEKSEQFRARLNPLFEKLALKYSIDDPSDIEAIIGAAEKDNSYYEDYASRLGVDVEGAKQLLEAKRITEENERRIQSERSEKEFRERFEGWLKQADETRLKYPSFDFEYESTNEETGEAFRRLLNSGIDVETAFTVIHKNEIMGGAMQYAYRAAKQEMADARTSRLSRPTENGTSNRQASAFLDDMSKLKPEQRRLIKAAVSRGEKVSAENFRKFL